MSEEAELIIELWSRLSEYVNDNDKLGAAHQLLQSFDDHGYHHVCEELGNNSDGLDEPLGNAAQEWL